MEPILSSNINKFTLVIYRDKAVSPNKTYINPKCIYLNVYKNAQPLGCLETYDTEKIKLVIQR